MVADHSETFLREGGLALHNMIQILRQWLSQWRARKKICHHETNLVVSPGEHDIIKATVGLIDTIFC